MNLTMQEGQLALAGCFLVALLIYRVQKSFKQMLADPEADPRKALFKD